MLYYILEALRNTLELRDSYGDAWRRPVNQRARPEETLREPKFNPAIGVREFGVRQDFDGNSPVQPRISRPKDFTHTTGTDLREDLVRAEPFSGRERHMVSTILC